MQRPDWKELITDDCKLVFDLDLPCYNAAASNEDKIFKVFLKETGEELFKEKDVEVMETVCINTETLGAFYNGNEEPIYEKRNTGKFINKRFKNKTDFLGRTRKTISGWLGEHNKEREAKGKEPYTRDDFLYETEQIAKPVSFAIKTLKDKIQSIADYLCIHDHIYLIGSGENHRHKLDLPMDPRYPDDPSRGQYKANRTDMKRPLLLEDVRAYAENVLRAEHVKGIEADDRINFFGWESHLHYKRTGLHKYILVSLDKDNCSYDSLLFNYQRTEDKKAYKYPHPILIDGYGSLFEDEKGKVRGYGYSFRLLQILIGDSTDGFSPTANLGIKYGEKSAYDVLKDCKTLKEGCDAVVKQYWKWFPSGKVSFTSWTGKDVTMEVYEWINTIYACAYMLKSRDDTTKFTDILDSLGVEYKTNPNKPEEENL
jgi:hypothetical protein